MIKLIIVMFLFITISAQHRWDKLSGPVGADVTFLYSRGDTIIIGAGHKGTIFYTFNSGDKWLQSNFKIPVKFRDIVSTSDEAFIVAAEEYGLYKSFDLVSWSQIFYTGREFWSLGKDYNRTIYAATEYTEIYTSTDNGINWFLDFDGYGGRLSFLLKDSILFAGAWNKIYKKRPNQQWDSSSIYTIEERYKIFADTSGNIYAHNPAYLLKSCDDGQTWILLDSNGFFLDNYIYSMIFNERLLAGCGDETGWFGDGWGVALSDDGGLTWRWQNNGIPKKIFVVGSLAKSGDITYAGTSSAGVFKSTDFGESWTPINNGLNAATSVDLYFESDGTFYTANAANGFQKSTDNGESWEIINNGLTNSYCYSIVSDSTGILLGGTAEGTFRSSDKGENWLAINGPGNDFAYYLKKDKLNRIYALTYGTGLYRTTDLGDSWVKLDNGWLSGYVFGFAIDSSGSIYAGIGGGAIYKSTNDGQSWAEVYQSSISNSALICIQVAPNGYIYALNIFEGILRSTDNGLSWELVNNGINWLRANGVAITSKGEIFASFSESNANYAKQKIFYSQDNGESWIDYTSGLDLIEVYNIRINENDEIYLATDESVWKFNPDSTTDISDNKIIISEYSLHQNYPNPFNPSTKISYTLKDEGNVKLLIYDIKGELISTLVNEKQQAGNYEVDFTLPGSISTGVYIYRLTVTDNSSHNVIFSDVKKMVYLK